jgi:hypothetical protein
LILFNLKDLEVDILRPVTIGVAAAAWWGVPALSGQTASAAKESQVWGLQGIRTGYCVRFLMEPGKAERELDKGFRLLRADQDQTLHPALQHVIRGQPEFAAWVPANLCFYFTDAVQVGSRRIAEKNPRNFQMIATWTLAAQEQKSGTRRDMVLDMYANRGSLIRAAEAARVRLHEAQTVVTDRPDTTADVYSVKLSGTLLIWNGRPTGDSTRVEQPMEESWSVPGIRGGGLWAVRLAVNPAWSRPLVGSLTVEGKGDLAKALKGSPIRFVGPLYRGGAGEMRFSR